MRRLVLAPFAGLLALFPIAFSQVAGAQTGRGSFTISENGKPVGSASLDFVATPQGYESSSLVRVNRQGLDYALSKTEKLSSGNELQHVLLSATVNGEAVTVTAAPDSAQILMNTSANGRSATTRLPAHSAAVFLPDFDPGALETLLALAVEHNNRGLWAIIPKQAGSIEPIQIATYADESGTLEGNPVGVHHLVITFAGAQADLFSGPSNQLLQAELPQQGFALVRKGFVLTPPARAAAPPAQ